MDGAAAAWKEILDTDARKDAETSADKMRSGIRGERRTRGRYGAAVYGRAHQWMKRIRILCCVLALCVSSMFGAYGIEAFAETTYSMDGVVVFLKNNWGVYNERLETYDYQAPDIVVRKVTISKERKQGSGKAYTETVYTLGDEIDANVTITKLPGQSTRKNTETGEKESYLNWTAGKSVTLQFTIDGVDGITQKNILVSVDPTQTDTYKSLEDVNNFTDVYVPLDNIKVKKSGDTAKISVSYTPVIQLSEKDILAGKTADTKEKKAYLKIGDADAYTWYKDQQTLAEIEKRSQTAEGYPSVGGGKWRYYKEGGRYQLTDADGNYTDQYYTTPGWLLADGEWYYIGENGYSVRGTQTIDGKTYTFDDYGKLTS